ncbi:MAG: Carbamoyltransferase [Methanoregula sp. PtaU1.Bin051]|nr:MAG: Carbamoyltransferase [Methanoregula sp. PtaU1.Bin051]
MSDPYTVMGIHDNHNACVSILRNGELLFVVQEERINRVKNYNGFPDSAIRHALDWCHLALEDIDCFAFGSIHNPPQRTAQEQKEYYGQSPMKRAINDVARATPAYSLYKRSRMNARKKWLESRNIPLSKVRFLDHHTVHAASTLYSSGFSAKDTLLLTLDGGGDGRCAGVFVCDSENRIIPLAVTPENHSVGNIYSLTTFHMGMTPLEHEYKLMGMAPYSQEKYYKDIVSSLSGLLDVDGMRFRRKTLLPTPSCLTLLERIYRRRRFDTICGGLQEFTERLVCRWVANCIESTGIHRLALSGGVFMNVKMNRKIMDLPVVEEMFVMPSCGDESNPIGAAYLANAQHCHETGREVDNRPPRDLYLGEDFDDSTVIAEIRKAGYECRKEPDMASFAADMLAEDRIVARCAGRAEWGARALGNRSILANPRSYRNVQRINDAIKMRDFWMPFAATVLDTYEQRYIINPKGVKSPYMIMSYATKPEAGEIVAATHPKDHTVRPQILTNSANREYYAIIESFARKTGTGAVLNTSFNLHGEPMVYHPSDAVHTLENSDLDILILNRHIVTK